MDDQINLSFAMTPDQARASIDGLGKHWAGSMASRTHYLVWLIPIAWIVLVALFWRHWSGRLETYLIVTLGSVLAGYAMAIASYLAFLTAQKAKAVDGITSLGNQQVRLDANGVESSNEIFSARLTWTDIADVVDADDVLILMHRGNGMVYIPHSALPPGMTRDDLKARIAAWRAVA